MEIRHSKRHDILRFGTFKLIFNDSVLLPDDLKHVQHHKTEVWTFNNAGALIEKLYLFVPYKASRFRAVGQDFEPLLIDLPPLFLRMLSTIK